MVDSAKDGDEKGTKTMSVKEKTPTVIKREAKASFVKELEDLMVAHGLTIESGDEYGFKGKALVVKGDVDFKVVISTPAKTDLTYDAKREEYQAALAAEASEDAE